MAMLEYDFMRNAFAAATIVAIVAGLVGYFLVLRGQAFAGHALAHVGFAGASGAVLVGIAPLWGMVALTVMAGIGMGAIGERFGGRDVAIGIVLAFSLGLGLLFLHFFTAYATQATALLFGNVLAVDVGTIWTLLWLGVVSVGTLALISRPLLFASLLPELAEAKGVVLWLYSVLFLAIVALAVAECVQIVGALLVFSLMVGPAAAAQRLTTAIWNRALPVRRARFAGGLDGDRAGLLHRLAGQLLDHRVEHGYLRVCGHCLGPAGPGTRDSARSASRTRPIWSASLRLRLRRERLVEPIQQLASVVGKEAQRAAHGQRLVGHMQWPFGMDGDDRRKPTRHAERAMRVVGGQEEAVQRVVVLEHHHVPFDDDRPAVQFHDRSRESRLFAVRDLDLRKAVPGHHPLARRYNAEQRRGGFLDRQSLCRACPE